MGRKVCLKKIENVTKCQVTFSKRRSSLIKKAQEISICCDAEVALVAFSPSGRISKFCSPNRIEEVIDRYVNLPADIRYKLAYFEEFLLFVDFKINKWLLFLLYCARETDQNFFDQLNSDIENVQEKLEKLRQHNHIKGGNSKLHYLDKQVENLELQIKKSTLQLQILENEIRTYESEEQVRTLNQLIWNEGNIKNSLAKVIERKNIISARLPLSRGQINIPMQMAYEGVTSFLNNFSSRDSNAHVSNPLHGKHPMRLDPWLVPNRSLSLDMSRTKEIKSTEVCEGFLERLINQENRKYQSNQGIAISTSYCNPDTSDKIQLLPLKLQPPRPLMVHETQIVQPVKNAFRSIAQSNPETPCWGVFSNGSFSKIVHDIQPPEIERTTPLPLDENLYTTFAFHNPQIVINNTQAPNDQVLPVSEELNIWIQKHNDNDINNSTILYKKKSHNSGLTGSIREIGEPYPQPELFSIKFPPKNLIKDDKPWTSYSQEG